METIARGSQLAQRLLDGEAAAFDAWFDRYFPRVYGYVARRVGAAADARELTREILGAALVDLPGGLDDEALDLWVFGATRRRVRAASTAPEGLLPAAS